jgi:uncharacterized membrane protein
MMASERLYRRFQFGLSVLGLIISMYLTAYHYTSVVPLACPDTGIINCANVLNSPYAYLFGIPIAVFGVLFFVVEIYSLLRLGMDQRFLINSIGIGFVAYFIYLEYRIGNICIYCTTVHVIVVLLFALSLYEELRHK